MSETSIHNQSLPTTEEVNAEAMKQLEAGKALIQHVPRTDERLQAQCEDITGALGAGCKHEIREHSESTDSLGCLISHCPCKRTKVQLMYAKTAFTFNKAEIEHLLINCFTLAVKVHSSQVDLLGIPYMFHIMRVAGQMTDIMSTCVALLHDVVEDSSQTIDELTKTLYVPPLIKDRVRLISHEKNTPYLPYIRDLMKDPVTRQVKTADVLDNISRVSMISDDGVRERLYKKYTGALAILTEQI